MAGAAVLIVEDEPDGQEVVSSILAHHNISSESVPTAEQAIEALNEFSYQVVVIDFALPRMDGLTLLKTIRKTPEIAHLPCVIVTAFHTSTVKRQFLDAGADAYLPKPLNNDDLMREVGRLLNAN